MRVTLLANPRAGRDRYTMATLADLIGQAQHQVSSWSTKDPGWKSALTEPADLIAVAGGDGAVAEVFRAMAGQPGPVAVLPTGSANNIARTLGLPEHDLAALIATWHEGIHRRFGICHIRGGHGEATFVEAAGGGFFSDLLRLAGETADEADEAEKVSRGLELLESALADAPARRWKLSVDGTEASGEYIGVELMRIREIGPHLALAAGADPFTDRFQVVTIRPEDRRRVAEWLRTRTAVASTLPLELPTWTGSSVEFDVPSGCSVHLDDELWAHTPRASSAFQLKAEAGVAWIDLLLPAIARRTITRT